MDLTSISKLINEHGLAVTLLVLILIGAYKTFSPYISKKLGHAVENEDNLEDSVRNGFFKLVEETRAVNKEIVSELQNINATNKELSETNKELAMANRKLVESYDRRICILEDTTNEIGKTVEKINTKIDVMLK